MKKLAVWIKKLQSFRLFEIGNNAIHDLSKLMLLPISAALNKRSVEYEASIEDRPSATDFYHHFNHKLREENITHMFLRYVAEIIKMIKNIFHNQKYPIAIDKTDDPYWGDKDNLFVTGGKRNKSTNWAHRYLTAAIVLPEIELILYARPLTKNDNNDALLIEECLLAVKRLGINVSTVLLDREFYNSLIVLLCNIKEIDFIIPAVKNSRFKRLIRELKTEKKKLPRIIENYEIDKQFANLVIYEDTNSKGKKEIFGFITNKDADKIQEDVYEIVEFYRRRWAIENANKFQDAFSIHTNSTNGLVRYFFFVLSALLQNFWVLINFMRRQIHLCELSLNMFKDILKAVFGLAPLPKYKHAQRKPWLGIVLG